MCSLPGVDPGPVELFVRQPRLSGPNTSAFSHIQTFFSESRGSWGQTLTGSVWALCFSVFFLASVTHSPHVDGRYNALMRASTVGVRAKPAALPASLSRRTVLSEAAVRYGCRKCCLRPVRSKAVISQWQSLTSVWNSVSQQASALSVGEIPLLSGMLDKGDQHALLLSTLAGLSTSIGGAIAIVKKPGNDLLSFLLGIAIGVMATLSVLEMWLHNAVEHGPIAITAATAAGVALYYAAQPYFPDFETHQVTLVR